MGGTGLIIVVEIGFVHIGNFAWHRPNPEFLAHAIVISLECFVQLQQE